MTCTKIKNAAQKPWFAAFVSGAAAGILTHLFGLVNVLHNFDDIAVQPSGYGTGLRSGRWLLSILGAFVGKHFGDYNLTYVKGLGFILLLAACAALVVVLFRLKKRSHAAFIGAVFVVFPCTTATLLYRYTVIYYGIALLLSVLAVYFLDRFKFGLPLSVLCIAFSLGIYQAYVPVTITLFVILLIQKALKGEKSFSKLVLWGLYACTALVLGLGMYYLILHICLQKNGVALGTYQGISDMGKLTLTELPTLIKRMYSAFLKLPVQDYCSIAQTKLIRLCYLLLGIISVWQTGYVLATRVRKLLPSLFVIAMGIVLPIAFNFIILMCPNSRIYTLMVYSLALAPCFPIILSDGLSPSEIKWQQLCEGISSKVLAAVLTLLILLYGYTANVNYSYLYYSNRQTENLLSSIVTQVRMTEGFTADKKWAFVGDFSDPLLNGSWKNVSTLNGNASPHRLITAYSRNNWLKTYVGYSVPIATNEELENLSKDPRVSNMPCWPDNGSISVIDDTVVIKFGE